MLNFQKFFLSSAKAQKDAYHGSLPTPFTVICDLSLPSFHSKLTFVCLPNDGRDFSDLAEVVNESFPCWGENKIVLTQGKNPLHLVRNWVEALTKKLILWIKQADKNVTINHLYLIFSFKLSISFSYTVFLLIKALASFFSLLLITISTSWLSISLWFYLLFSWNI